MAIDYAKLAEDLKVAKQAAIEAAPGDDGLASNLDTLVIGLLHARETSVQKALKEAGLRCGRWGRGGDYWIGAPVLGYQGFGITRQLEAMKRVMHERGWTMHIHYQLD